MTEETLEKALEASPTAADKQTYIESFIRSFLAVEQAIEPFKEQMKELREEYVENNWLTKEEIRNLIKALRLHTQKVDPNDLIPYSEQLAKIIGE